MGLIIKDTLKSGSSPYADVSSFYITVDAKYLSNQYRIPILFTRTFAKGEILEVSKVAEPLNIEEKIIFEKHVIGKEVRFYVSPAVFFVTYDTLYFDNSSWSIIRDAGIFPNVYELKVKINAIENLEEKKVLSVYPYRDVEAR